MNLFKNRKSLLYSILFVNTLLSANFAACGQIASETYVVDKKESVITWKCAMQFVPQNAHTGFIYTATGELAIAKGQLASGTVEIDMNSIQDERHESDNNLVEHIKSPDFFDAKQFPISTFVITDVATVKGEGLNITGNLTVKGITHAITFPVKSQVKAGVLNAAGKVTIDRTKWDVQYGSGKFFGNLADDTISDEIELNVKIVARKK